MNRIVFLALCTVPLFAGCGIHAPLEGPASAAVSPQESPSAPVPAPPSGPAEESPKAEQLFPLGSFENPETCSTCHSKIYEQWSRSMHGYAWENKWYKEDYQKAHKETKGATDMLCGACHSPPAAKTGQFPTFDGSNFDETAKRGISCDFCHTVTGVEKLHNMGHVNAPGEVKRANRGDGRSLYHKVEFSDIHTKAEFCGSCHNVIHPANGVAIIDTYEDWKNNDYGKQGVRCQDCHMTPGLGEKNPGHAAGMGIYRDHVAFHGFTGGSSYIQEALGNKEQAQRARKLLRSAAALELAPQVKEDGTLELTVDVHNVGAGHKIPTGVTYIRKMWLQVEVLDEKGKKVYSSGDIRKDNRVDPDAAFFRVLFRDANGELTGKSWRATGIGYDRRIPAKGKEREVYRIPLPAKGKYTVTTRLMYRSFSQETLDSFPQAPPPIENVEMAKATAPVSF